MKKSVSPSSINGVISAPPSKSYMQRAIAVSLLAKGKSKILYPSYCNDAISALNIAEALGATIVKGEDFVEIDGGLNLKSNQLNCGESGLGMRMFSPIAALFDKEIFLNGEGTALTRPVNMVETPLKKLGVDVESNNGLLPLKIKGPIKNGVVEIDGSISSQFLTGLLITLPVFEKNSIIEVDNLKSKPYIKMTLDVMYDFGVSVSNFDYQIYKILGNQKYMPTEYAIEGDWSGAAFPLVAAAINGKVTIDHLKVDSFQADRAIIDVLKKAGANIEIDGDKITVSKSELHGFQFDATHCPDLFPPLVALAAHCKGMTSIKGMVRLIFKESDRAKVLKEEFSKLGVQIEVFSDKMIIHGGGVIGGVVHSNNDHRIAMAAATIALKAKRPVIIEDAECVAKSYPNFFEDIQKLGVEVNDVE
jgi:3-phosphoshikimate 1-carboxyvinyltransferase